VTRTVCLRPLFYGATGFQQDPVVSAASADGHGARSVGIKLTDQIGRTESGRRFCENGSRFVTEPELKPGGS